MPMKKPRRPMLGALVLLGVAVVGVLGGGVVIAMGNADLERSRRTQAAPALDAVVIEQDDHSEKLRYIVDFVDPKTERHTRRTVTNGDGQPILHGGDKR